MNRIRFRIAVAVLLSGALALSLAGPASAFIRITRQASPTSPVVQAHWNDADLPLVSVIDPTNADQPSATALSIVQTSAETWENINTSFLTVDPVPFSGSPQLQPALAFDGQNSMFFDAAGVNFPVAGVIAFVRSIIDGTDGHTLDADMVFNDRDFFASVSTPNLTPAPAGQSSVDLQAVVTHEYGHYFGLDHTSVLGGTMIPFIQNNISQRTLELDDRAGNSTIYPESASRPGGLSPGAVDFGATTGTISGTVVSGYDGSAIFGAHVEAYLLSDPTPVNEISAVSGELTVRNGQGDFTIHGLPPGDYAVAIVPMDGIHTTCADANVGGIFNGIDINFEPEFWNGSNESGNGFNDNANDFSSVSVGAGANTGGVNFITNTFPGRVTIAQYGAFENIVTFRNTGYLAVRFDPPFAPPYTINNVDFPSFTFNGVPAPFLSARLCGLDQTTGLPDIANPLFVQTPFNGNPNGINTVPLNLTINQPNQTFFWALQYPSQSTPGFPNNFPFLRMDFVSLERGNFANSYSMPTSGTSGAGILVDRNIVVSMTCQMSAPEVTPIVAPSNLGANRRPDFTEFSFAKPSDTRADGFPMPGGSLNSMNLIMRLVGAPGTYSTVTSVGEGAKSIKLTPGPATTPIMIWSSQATDDNLHNSLQSNVTITGLGEDADEPNGSTKPGHATVLSLPAVNRPESYSPAGESDFYEISAKTGDVIDVAATHVGTLDGRNDPDYVMFLYDKNGKNILAFNDDFTGLDPRIVFTAPPPATGNDKGKPQRFVVQVTDFYGSLLFPNGAPRIPTPLTYRLDASVTPAASSGSATLAGGINPNDYNFVMSGPNPANPIAKFLYIIPRSQGSQDVRLRIYDVSGRLVRTLVNGTKEPGPYTALWNGRDDLGRGVASGNYYARIQMGTFTKNTQVTILK
ncbi:MAG TPA: matrixin family metalloprotease [Candidatus Eisenbacteria bacterium]|nr:matrixin family metalloprotease [Candidatus Eisenbacteria bacterium]